MPYSQVTVNTTDGATRAWPKESVLDCTTTEVHVKDHCNLDVLNSATLVENTKQRFVNDEIYTCAPSFSAERLPL